MSYCVWRRLASLSLDLSLAQDLIAEAGTGRTFCDRES
jgi:hypothetical protein